MSVMHDEMPREVREAAIRWLRHQRPSDPATRRQAAGLIRWHRQQLRAVALEARQ